MTQVHSKLLIEQARDLKRISTEKKVKRATLLRKLVAYALANLETALATTLHVR